MNYLFFVGNKRCGTTLMVNLLNLHPDIFVSHESDLIWILYQIQTLGCTPQQYEWDGWLGMSETLKASRLLGNHHIVKDYKLVDPAEEFNLTTLHLMTYGNEVQRRYDKDKETLQWIGDKKPVQCCDPNIRPFLLEHFPDAKYLHMVRDPMACIASKMTSADRAILAGDTRGLPHYWQASTDVVTERWITHEEWALQVEKESPTARLLLEDLCYAPVTCMKEVFHFLGLDMPDDVIELVMQMVEPGPNTKYDGSEYDSLRASMHESPRAGALMKEYGYG